MSEEEREIDARTTDVLGCGKSVGEVGCTLLLLVVFLATCGRNALSPVVDAVNAVRECQPMPESR